MAPRKAASWWRFRGSWGCRYVMSESERRQGICCRSIPQSLWIRCLNRSNYGRRRKAVAVQIPDRLIEAADGEEGCASGGSVRLRDGAAAARAEGAERGGGRRD